MYLCQYSALTVFAMFALITCTRFFQLTSSRPEGTPLQEAAIEIKDHDYDNDGFDSPAEGSGTIESCSNHLKTEFHISSIRAGLFNNYYSCHYY
jgi:hypothetical protein